MLIVGHYAWSKNSNVLHSNEHLYRYNLSIKLSNLALAGFPCDGCAWCEDSNFSISGLMLLKNSALHIQLNYNSVSVCQEVEQLQ